MLRLKAAISVLVTLVASSAVANTVVWTADDRSAFEQAIFETGYSQVWTPDPGTTSWLAGGFQNSTIDSSPSFGGFGSGYATFYNRTAGSTFDVSFNIAGGGTTLVLGGELAASNSLNVGVAFANFDLYSGTDVIYSASVSVGGSDASTEAIDYSGFLTDGNYRIVAFTEGQAFAESFSSWDFSGTFGTSDVTLVPVPATVWLFGSALAGLGWVRRRRGG